MPDGVEVVSSGRTFYFPFIFLWCFFSLLKTVKGMKLSRNKLRKSNWKRLFSVIFRYFTSEQYIFSKIRFPGWVRHGGCFLAFFLGFFVLCSAWLWVAAVDVTLMKKRNLKENEGKMKTTSTPLNGTEGRMISACFLEFFLFFIFARRINEFTPKRINGFAPGQNLNYSYSRLFAWY